MDIYNSYNVGTAGWLSIQGIALLTAPKLVISILSPEVHTPTDLETYFSRSLSLSLLTISILSLLLTNIIPVFQPANSPDNDTPSAAAASPFASATVTTTTIYHSLSAVYMYLSYSQQSGTASHALGALVSAGLAAGGGWCLLFANDRHISRQTGADKRTSGWPFKNDVAAERKSGKKRL